MLPHVTHKYISFFLHIFGLFITEEDSRDMTGGDWEREMGKAPQARIQPRSLGLWYGCLGPLLYSSPTKKDRMFSHSCQMQAGSEISHNAFGVDYSANCLVLC